MPFVPFEDCVQLTIEGHVDGQLTINDLAFRSSIGPRSAADVFQLANAVGQWYIGFMVTLLNEAWIGSRVTAKGLTNQNGLTAEVSLLGNDGAITGEAAPNNCSMCVSFRTGAAGRSNRGRNYIPVLTNSQVSGNMIDSAWAADVVAAYAMLTFPASVDVLPGGWIWVVLSRFSGGVERTVGQFTEINNVLVSDLVVDSQRRRLPGRGR